MYLDCPIYHLIYLVFIINHYILYYSPLNYSAIQGARHTYGQAVGKNIANPTAMFFCASKMLRHVNLHDYARLVQTAVEKVLANGKVKTRDLGGYASTTDFTKAVIEQLG